MARRKPRSRSNPIRWRSPVRTQQPGFFVVEFSFVQDLIVPVNVFYLYF